MKKKVLYIEDEPFLARIVKETLELKDYEVLHKKDGGKIMETVRSFAPDICILDVMLPGADGYTLGTDIRSANAQLPIIFLTAKGQTEDVLKGFSSGGTDYLKKPFSMEELMVRIENQLRLNAKRNQLTETLNEEVRLGNYQFHPGRYELRVGDVVIKLSSRESEVLNVLCDHINKTTDRRRLLTSVWGDDSFFNSRNLDVYIRKLRDYFSEDPRIEIITLKGKGYHFVVPI
ncbi:MAG: response regulator transcription factor [Bacteroidetes bacterium]|nr:response regulator transcription factor [Bacteroidota bacterium]